MSRYLDNFEPEDVRFLMDLSEFKEFIVDMLGDTRDSVDIRIDFDYIEEPGGASLVRPMVHLTEASQLTEEKQQHLRDTGFSIGDEPYANGDYAMDKIFGPHYVILAATEDEDGAFFTIEMPYRHYIHQKNTV
ncbi:hypothetical protein SAMN04487936_10947 [Halobacillus dabanensis]|uniref:Uncharacterized protein n=1 Tax=Halobacillus dabanensis TaxID=240302 RepID=A0A1I3XN27_HALDA|nr:hypothetical protein [Halobacillus dabanensis]SFK20952.1 hypothetical protein SAMN04487936_10947 [Halobacillus dabanensis]